MKPFFFRSYLSPAPFVAIASLAVIAGCGSSDSGTGGNDASTADGSVADTGPLPHVDAGGTPPSDGSASDVVTAPDDGGAGDDAASDSGESDGATKACSSASDCRLYSSSCDTCVCMALGKSDPNPTCSGTIVTCFVDPCEGKSATCNNGHCGGN